MEMLKTIDALLIDTVDGFCRQIQTRLNYVAMMTVISFGSAAIALAASVLMARDWSAAQFAWPAAWGCALILMTMFFRKTLWRDGRRWSSSTVMYWMKMSAMMRRNGLVIRMVTLLGTLALALLNIPFLIHGDSEQALMSYKFLFVSMFPIILMMYAFCAMPLPTQDMLSEAAEQLRRNFPHDPEV